MDLIYTDINRQDLGVLHNYEMDLAFGADENDFSVTLAAVDHCCTGGAFLYLEDTEYGGIVDDIQSKTASQKVIYHGRTWHGILGSKVILPLQLGETSSETVSLQMADGSGASLVGRYLIASGDANACIDFVLQRLGLGDLFRADAASSGLLINQYRFDRYVDGYTGLRRMLNSTGAKLRLKYTAGAVTLCAVPALLEGEFDSDQFDLDARKRYRTVNHLICLGKGELENRLVVHLYADQTGSISQVQTQFGVDEYTAVYDYSSAESPEELLDKGSEKLRSLCAQDNLTLDADPLQDIYDVGDTICASDHITGLQTCAAIAKKIISIKNGRVTIDIRTDS